ncbi:MAG: hypothetical protein CMJ54_00885, partial [Planctomycetaceae bacterium]|nr:hypothetical protein [Planctomycetaceae bacterium]
MYQPLLANRYLASRIIPLIAVAAVALCVGLVIIVVSVMSGFLDMLLNSGRTLMGDVIVRYADPGIPHYDLLVEEIESRPEAEAATPVVESFGLLKLPYGNRTEGVQVWGIDPETFDRVVDFQPSLVWDGIPPEVEELAKEFDRIELPDLEGLPQLDPLTEADPPKVVLGVEIDSATKARGPSGDYEVRAPAFWLPLRDVEITLIPISTSGRIEKPDNRRFSVANEFQSGVYQIDSRRAMIGIETGQRMLGLDAAPIYDQALLDETGELSKIGTYPARVQMILVRAAEGVTPEALRDSVREAYASFAAKIADETGVTIRPPDEAFVGIRTWREQLRDMIGPVEKERELMRILFSIVYLVCAGLVLSIFWAIVHEKTRDIGILRAVGASRPGVLGVFLTYGLVIGLAGAVLGALLGWIVVNNINGIHEAMGEPAPTWTWIVAYVLAAAMFGVVIQAVVRGAMLRTLLSIVGVLALGCVGTALLLHRGFLMWDPAVYYFNSIPNQVDWFSATLTMAGAIVFSVLGAAIPAAKAADTDPVRALR